MVGKRKRPDGLPARVYLKHGAYYFVDRDNKWHRLGKERAEMFKALAELMAGVDLSMASVLSRYERDILPTKAPKTQQVQRPQLAKLRAVFGRCHPDSISSGDIAQYLDASSAKVQANREIALLSHVYKKAIRWRLAASNPCRGVERNKEQQRDRYVTNDEYIAVYEVAPAPVRLMMDLAYLTGQRQSDLLKLQWSDCTATGLLVHQGKTGRKLEIRWSSDLRFVIQRARKADTVSMTHIVVGASGQPYTFWGFQGAWRRVWGHEKLAGLERFTFHDLRAKAGTDAKSGDHLGHLDQRTFERTYRRKPKSVEPTQ